jgi:mRNA interferase HigB
MQLVGETKLRDFWKNHLQAENPLQNWIQITKAANWKTFADVRNAFRSADVYKCCTIFDIGGNKYRMITKISYDNGIVYVKEMLMHFEYDAKKWCGKCEYF